MDGNLQDLLRKKNISMKDFSMLLGVSEKTAYNKLQGVTDFTLPEVKKINKCLFPEYDFDFVFDITPETNAPLKEAS